MIRDQNYSQHIWSDEKYYFYFPKNTRSAKNLPWDLFVFVFVFFCMQHFQAWTRLISVIWVRVPIVKLPFLYHCFHHITLLLVPSVQDYAYRIQKCQVKWGHYFIWLNIYKLHDLYYFMKKRTINHLIIISKSFKVKTKKTQDIHGWLMWWVPTFSAEDSHSIPASKKKKIPWRKEWQPTPVSLPGEFYGLRRLRTVLGSLLSLDFRMLQYFWVNNSKSVLSVAELCLTLHIPMDCSTPGFPVHHQLPEPTQTHVHHIGDAIQPSHPLSSPSPPAFNLSQHQGLFQWVSSSHQEARVLEFQLQHQSFQRIFRTDFF